MENGHCIIKQQDERLDLKQQQQQQRKNEQKESTQD